MSLSTWRQFPFFDCVPIRDPNYGSKDALYSDSTISSICSTPEYLVIATSQSIIKLIDKSFQLVFEFDAYELGWSITKLKYINLGNNEGYLCSIAERQGQPLSFKLWNLKNVMTSKKFDFNTDFHTMCQVVNGSNNYPLTCFGSSLDFSTFAFGFANGSVILVRGDLLHDKGTRQRVVYESKEPITGVHFKDGSLLYVSTVSKILTIPTTGRNQGRPDRILDDKAGVDIECSDIVQDSKKSLVVAKEESLQFYNSRGSSHSLILNIPKKKLHVYKDRYILIVSSVDSNLTSSSTVMTNKLIIVDIANKFISFNQSISSSVMGIFEMWDDLYVLTSDGLLYKLHEKTMKEKLDIVVQRELFPIAIRLAESYINESKLSSVAGGNITITAENEDQMISSKGDDLQEEQILLIKKQYGDYLYNKGEFEDAIKQYIDCVELGKTSEIIQKYKDSSKIPLLTTYLEKLIDLKRSNEDHVTLLLCSYCKLKQPESILNFIEDIEIDEDFEIVSPFKKFNLETVINLCRDSGYFKLASMIAKKFNRPSIVVDIQLSDLKSPTLTMKYIKTLTIDELLRVLIDNVETLLHELPNESTQLLIEVFTGKFKPEQPFNMDSMTQVTPAPNGKESETDYPILTSYRQFVSFMNLTEEEESVTEPTYLPPRPRIVFHSFANNPREFVIFLEACIESYDKFGGNEKDKKDIMITLYEMYLTLSNEGDDEKNRQEWQDKAKSLLYNIQKNWNLEDQTNLLLLSSLGDFNEGEILIRESADDSSEGFEMDMFRSAILAKNYDKSLEIMNKYGDKEPELYKLALSTYTQTDQMYELIGEHEIMKIIAKIESLKLLTPLELIKQLSLTNFIKLGLIKNYLISHIRKQKQEIINNEKLISSYKAESANLSDSLSKLKTDFQVINQSRCSSCQQPLEFPLVHFKCSHSYHEQCLTVESNQNPSTIPHSNRSVNSDINGSNSMAVSCPKCIGELDALGVLKKQHEEIGERNDLFKASLQDNSDRFKVMMGFFGRGAMEQSKKILQ